MTLNDRAKLEDVVKNKLVCDFSKACFKLTSNMDIRCGSTVLQEIGLEGRRTKCCRIYKDLVLLLPHQPAGYIPHFSVHGGTFSRLHDDVVQ